MRQDQLEHAIRTACQIIGRHEVIVAGSQSILGTFREDQLPPDATRSVEIDILPIADNNSETERLADFIEGVAGEFSPFEELHGFSIDGVDLTTSALPMGWRGSSSKPPCAGSPITSSMTTRCALSGDVRLVANSVSGRWSGFPSRCRVWRRSHSGRGEVERGVPDD